MAILKCLSNYSSSLGTYQKGDKTDNLSEDAAALLLRDSPGSFERFVPKPKPVEESTEETASGVSAPDRRARGGRKR